MVRCNGNAGREKLNIQLGARQTVQALCAAASRSSCVQQQRVAATTQILEMAMPLPSAVWCRMQ